MTNVIKSNVLMIDNDDADIMNECHGDVSESDNDENHDEDVQQQTVTETVTETDEHHSEEDKVSQENTILQVPPQAKTKRYLKG